MVIFSYKEEAIGKMTLSINFLSILLACVWGSPVLVRFTRGNVRFVGGNGRGVVGPGLVWLAIAVVTVLVLCCLRSRRGLRL
jgi:hypothetical protein